jgi:hypothetical protein
MRQERRDFSRCELGGEKIEDGQYEIHQTKYQGATYYDLRIVCRSCNKEARERLTRLIEISAARPVSRID